jgi:hypothetical protein
VAKALVWRYLPGGVMVHALKKVASNAAVCGVTPPPLFGGWQNDPVTVVAMRRCRRCLEKLLDGAVTR